MTMKNLTRTEFDDIYDELNRLTEDITSSFLSNFTGVKNGEQLNNSQDTLLKYVDIDRSIESCPELADIAPQKWPALKHRYWMTCPNCGKVHQLSLSSLDNKLKKAKTVSKNHPDMLIPVERFARCPECAAENKVKKIDFGLLKDVPQVWDRIPDNILDKNTGILTDFGRKAFYDTNMTEHPENITNQNQNHKISHEFIDKLCSDKDFNFGQKIPKSTELYLPLVCPKHGLYTAKGSVAYKGRFDNVGCPECAMETGLFDSNSELLLYDALKSIKDFNIFDYIPTGWKLKVDIGLSYSGKKYAIEYDGAVWHQDEVAIDAAIKKTKLCIQDGYTVIRVCEQKSAILPETLAKTIILPTTQSFISLTLDNYLLVIQQICDIIGYKLTSEDIDSLKNIYELRPSIRTRPEEKKIKKGFAWKYPVK